MSDRVFPPHVVQWVTRNGADCDCAITAIHLATGLSYETVLAEALKVQKKPLNDGLLVRDMRAILHALKYETTLKRKYDRDKDTGLLMLKDVRKPSNEHVVYLWAGRVIEPRADRPGLWLDTDSFLATDKWKATTLLTLRHQDAHD